MTPKERLAMLRSNIGHGFPTAKGKTDADSFLKSEIENRNGSFDLATRL